MEQEIIQNKNREVEEMLDRKEDIEKSNEEHLKKLAVRFNVLEANNLGFLGIGISVVGFNITYT